MKTVNVSFPVHIKRLHEHEDIKYKMLQSINNQSEYDMLQSPGNDITRCDYKTSRFDKERGWVKFFIDPLVNHLENWCKDTNYNGFEIYDMWFQQYTTNSTHGWHNHGHNFTNVYYLELPEDSPQTEWLDPVDNKTVHKFDVKEGDIITFPSFLIHRAPINNSMSQKTIISWNMDTSFPDGYKAGNK